jgi:hypothetical protein
MQAPIIYTLLRTFKNKVLEKEDHFPLNAYLSYKFNPKILFLCLDALTETSEANCYYYDQLSKSVNCNSKGVFVSSIYLLYNFQSKVVFSFPMKHTVTHTFR